VVLRQRVLVLPARALRRAFVLQEAQSLLRSGRVRIRGESGHIDHNHIHE
jgi:hypothetical protein